MLGTHTAIMDTSAASLAQNSDNISWVALLVVILVLSLATILVAARFYTRIFILKHVGWDDYCVLLSLVRQLPPPPQKKKPSRRVPSMLRSASRIKKHRTLIKLLSPHRLSRLRTVVPSCQVSSLHLGFVCETALLTRSPAIPFGLGRHTATLDPVVIPLYLRVSES